MKKIALLVTAATSFFSMQTFADDITAKLQGRLLFEGAGSSQSKLAADEKYVTTNRKKVGANTNAFVGARVTAEHEDFKYGAQLSLFTSTNQTASPAYDRSHIFLESNYGKVELGSNFDVGTKMRITALTIARASGDDSEDYLMLDIKDAGGNVIATQPMFPSVMYFRLDDKKREGARKISYYTPKIGGNEYGGGLQFGVSYIPDSGNFGSLTMKDESDSLNKVKTYNIPGGNKYEEFYAVKDAVSAGVAYEHHMNDTTSMKLALTGEGGKSVKKSKKYDRTVNAQNVVSHSTPSEYKVSDLKSYNVGAIVTSGNFSVVGSYTDMGKSLTSPYVTPNSKKTRYYSAGAVYAQGPVGVSLSYYKAEKQSNKMNTYVLGTDYILAPGLQPYAEVAWFNGKGGLPSAYNDPVKRKFKGMVFLLGMTMAF